MATEPVTVAVCRIAGDFELDGLAPGSGYVNLAGQAGRLL